MVLIKFITLLVLIVYLTNEYIFYETTFNYNIFFIFSGAGQEVGRSCIVMEFKGKKIMASYLNYIYIILF